ncbi:MAG: trehalase family glycosidase [Bacteroidota bacterium]
MQVRINIFLILLVLGSLTLNKGCIIATGPEENILGKGNKAFPNVLDLNGIPKTPTDRSVHIFSDLGAWFGYALQDSIGGFTGPWLMTQDNGIWLSKNLMTLELKDQDANGGPQNVETFSYPGYLNQQYTVDGYSLDWKLIFITSRTAVLMVTITNHSRETRELEGEWKGKAFLEGVSFEKGPLDIIMRVNDKPTIGLLGFDYRQVGEMEVRKSEFAVKLKKRNIGPKNSVTYVAYQSFVFNEVEVDEARVSIAAKMSNTPQKVFEENRERWNSYLDNTFDHSASELDSTQKRVAVKCIQTLITNWRSPSGFLKHDGMFPSYSYYWFNGFWSWDSWKHAAAVVHFDPQLAKNQIRSMFDHQDEMGMIVDVFYRDTTIENHNWRDTKPPLSAWAVWKIYKQTQDKAFLEEMYPKITKYHNWWYQYRDHDQNGLCEFGSTDGTVVAAKWESGMDNAVRFDEVTILKNNDDGWSLDQESVDLNAYLFAEKQWLGQMAEVLGKPEEAEQFENDAKALQKQVRNRFFSKEKGYFYDAKVGTDKLITIEGPEGWTPLWTGLATKDQAKGVKAVMTDPTKFATHIPFPTVAADHPAIDPLKGYWRGPVWLDQAYFAIKGLERFGYEEEVGRFKSQLFDRLEGLSETAPLREHYHPDSGEGLRANHFSWTAAHLLLLLIE